MSKQITNAELFPYLTPKQEDIIRFIGPDEFKKEVSFAIQAANSQPYLAQATPASVAKAIFNSATVGLSLNPVLKLACLVPRRNDNEVEAVFMPMYQGLVKLVVDCGAALDIDSRLVYQGDVFEPQFGTEPNIVHIPKSSGKSKEIEAVYSVATLASGVKKCDVMWREEIDEIREFSDSYRSYKKGQLSVPKKEVPCIWVTWYGEMAKKTVLRRLWKYIPKSAGMDKVSEALEFDNQEYQAGAAQLGRIEMLLQSSTLDHEERAKIERELPDMGYYKAASLIQYLEDRQTDPIESGRGVSAGEISEKIAEKLEDEKA